MSDDISVQVKWAGPNTPFIVTGDGQRLYLSKRELVALAKELNQFIEFYKEDFTEDRLDIEDNPYDENI